MDQDDEYSKYLHKDLAPNNDSPKRIKEIDFGILGPKETRKMSTVNITKSDFCEPANENIPMVGGVLDLRLGSSSSPLLCHVCEQNWQTCPGHFGSIELLYPVFNPGYYVHIIHVLKCICKTCSHILLPKSDINRRLRSIWRPGSIGIYTRLDKMKTIIKECQKVTVCPHCGAINGAIRKTKNNLIIWHMISSKSDAIRKTYTNQFLNLKIKEQAISQEQIISNVSEDLTPIRVLHLFDNIPAREIPLLTYSKSISHPSDMIIKSFVVPPNTIRPSVVSPGEGTTYDDLTVRVREVIEYTHQLRKMYETGDPPRSFAGKWNLIQQTLNVMINSQSTDNPPKAQSKKDKAVLGYAQRLKGKKGRFRTNLSGKRVNFSGRSVISPDPNANVDQVVVPLEMAKILTFPTVVTKYNMKLLKKCMRNGGNKYPGANFVIKQDSDNRISLRGSPAIIENQIRNLKCGDIVERHLMDNDIVLFNRQPSLHRISIMAFRAKVMKWRTLRFNVCACAPFNADFDGDEMNIHLPQTLEAASDAKYLMNILNNLFSPRSGEMIVAPTQDFLSGSYLLTRKNVFLTYSQFSFLACQMFDSNIKLDIPMPAIIHPVPLWTGKQLISLMLKPNDEEPFRFTHSVKNKEYNYKKEELEFDENDGYVSFLDSDMISGVLEKSLIGGGGKSLFACMARDVSPQFAANIMGRIAKLSTRYMMNRGFSIGITDVTPTDSVNYGKHLIINEANNKSDQFIHEYDTNQFEPSPGLTREQTLEVKLNDLLSTVRDDIGTMCTKNLSPLNTALVMAKSGAKGSNINIAQMMGCVGQQVISGQRVIVDFIDRTIPHFKHNSLEPEAKGFVQNSFFSGLEPYEFFFHTMSGREGLVDAAVKTAETGYLQRRLMKFVEDAMVHYDGTVRMADGALVQFKYGDDGLDPLTMEDASFPVKLERLSTSVMRKNYQNHLLAPNDAIELFRSLIQSERSKPESPYTIPSYLFDKFNDFFENVVIRKYTNVLNSFKLEGAVTLEDFDPDVASIKLDEFHSLLSDESRFEDLENEIKELEEVLEQLRNEKRVTKEGRQKKKMEIEERESEIDAKKCQLLASRMDSADSLYQFIIDNFQQRIRLLYGVTEEYIREFVSLILTRLQKSLIEPGTTVGAIAGQSIGEPATQMTLRSFHYAGVASMNVTLGVPRIQEVMNAIKDIKTPVITAQLDRNKQESEARRIKGLIDKITLKQVASSIKQIQSPEGCFIDILLNLQTIEEAKLNINAQTIRNSIINNKALKVKPENIAIRSSDFSHSENDEIQISFRDRDVASSSFDLQELLLRIPDIPVSGLEGVNRVLITQDKQTKNYFLCVESNNFSNVLNTNGIDWRKTVSNHIFDVERVLGIEAARSVIVSEIYAVYDNFSLTIDKRHLLLIADTMTMKGRTNGINRHGLAKTCSSSLKLASFEVTMEHLYNAGFHQIQDQASDISSSVILGSFANIGSGMCQILVSNELISQPVLTPKFDFLTPQAPSELRNSIKEGKFVMPSTVQN